jgi:glycosyltransferase involved in cell wall biosynthesis
MENPSVRDQNKMLTHDGVTVVIPSFNRANSIGNALESVLSQTHSNWIALVVDDGSVDDTRQVVQSYSRKDSRIRLLQNHRAKGAQGARNTGIEAANTAWVAFLDSDDRYLALSLEMRLKCAADTGMDVVHSSCLTINSSGKNLMPVEIPPLAGNVYRDLLIMPGPMFQGLLIRKGAMEQIGLLDESLVSYQEWDTSIRLAKHFPFAYVTEPTFSYMINSADAISRNKLRSAIGYEHILKKHFAEILAEIGAPAIAHHYRILARLYWNAGQNQKAFRYLVAAVARSPLTFLYTNRYTGNAHWNSPRSA